MATAFARDYSGEKAPWAEYPADVEEWVRQLQNLPSEARYEEWMFAHPDGRRWIGYRAGTFLVDQAMARAKKTSIDLIGASAQEIIDMGSRPAQALLAPLQDNPTQARIVTEDLARF
jgi:uncharacterized protein YjaZ